MCLDFCTDYSPGLYSTYHRPSYYPTYSCNPTTTLFGRVVPGQSSWRNWGGSNWLSSRRFYPFHVDSGWSYRPTYFWNSWSGLPLRRGCFGRW